MLREYVWIYVNCCGFKVLVLRWSKNVDLECIAKYTKFIAKLQVNYLKYGTNDVIKLLYDRISMLVQGSLTNQQGYEKLKTPTNSTVCRYEIDIKISLA